jgi:thiamine biosynthesis lipoprotein
MGATVLTRRAAVLTRRTGPVSAAWRTWGTTARLAVTDPRVLAGARRLVRAELHAAQRACGRARSGSELSAVHRAAGQSVVVSSMLAALVRGALDAAAASEGLVDPTAGTALARLGGARDLSALPVCGSVRWDVPAASWRDVRLDGQTLTVPRHVLLDLGATAHAVAAERAAELVAARFGCGAVVSLGGDVASAGPVPAGGWPVGTATLPGGMALGGSSGGTGARPVVDLRTGRPVPAVWRHVEVVADSALAASTLATEAHVRGLDALSWLEHLRVSARLTAVSGAVATLGASSG